MPNRRYNKQVANQMKSGGRVKRMGAECLQEEEI